MRSRLRDSAGIPPTSPHHPGINPHQADSEHDIPHALRNASPAHLPNHCSRFTVVILHMPAHAAMRRGSHLIQHHVCHTPLNETPRTNLAQPKRICRPKRSEHTPQPPRRPHVRRIGEQGPQGAGPALRATVAILHRATSPATWRGTTPTPKHDCHKDTSKMMPTPLARSPRQDIHHHARASVAILRRTSPRATPNGETRTDCVAILHRTTSPATWRGTDISSNHDCHS